MSDSENRRRGEPSQEELLRELEESGVLEGLRRVEAAAREITAANFLKDYWSAEAARREAQPKKALAEEMYLNGARDVLYFVALTGVSPEFFDQIQGFFQSAQAGSPAQRQLKAVLQRLRSEAGEGNRRE